MNENEDKKEGDADHIERVRRRAHSIWMDEGQVHGRDHEHWHQAEREIAAETSAHAPPAAAEPRKASQAAAGGSNHGDVSAIAEIGDCGQQQDHREPQDHRERLAH